MYPVGRQPSEISRPCHNIIPGISTLTVKFLMRPESPESRQSATSQRDCLALTVLHRARAQFLGLETGLDLNAGSLDFGC
eukprot:6136413-Pyramimonas_sp.AAC.1